MDKKTEKTSSTEKKAPSGACECICHKLYGVKHVTPCCEKAQQFTGIQVYDRT
jgi:hypothetical protein